MVAAACAAPVSPAPSPSRAARSASLASGAASPSAAGWQVATLPDAASIAIVMDVAAGPTGIVAVGGKVPVGQAQAWSSLDDGTTWAAEAIPPDPRSPQRVVAMGDRFLAVGAGEFRCAHPVALGTWVRAPDGTWAAAPADPIFCAGGIFDVAVRGETAVIAGTGSGDVPFVWASRDGLRWVDRPSAVQSDAAPWAVIGGDDAFTVFGTSPAGLWAARSGDGSAWEVERLPAGERISILGAFVRDGQPAVVAAFGPSVGVISRDGDGAWRSEPADGLDATELGRIVALDRGAGGIVALGADPDGPTIHVSGDGTSWRSVELPTGIDAGAVLTSALVSRGRAVLTGQQTSDGRIVGTIWSGPATLLAPGS